MSDNVTQNVSGNVSEKVLTPVEIGGIVSRADDYVLSEELVAGSYADDVETLVKSHEALRALATELAEALNWVAFHRAYDQEHMEAPLTKARAAGVLQ